MPPESAALTVNQVCGSGLRAVSLAAQAMQMGDAEFVVAGGMESMSNAPYLLPQARSGYRMGNGTLVDAMINDGLWEAYRGYHMGFAAEMIAEKYGITRAEQDAFAAESHRRAADATERGWFRGRHRAGGDPAGEERRGAAHLRQGRSHPAGQLGRDLARLKPAFKEGGTVTAGNAPGVSDGGAAVVVTSAEVARERGLKPMALIRAQATAGREPEWFGLAPSTLSAKWQARPAWPLERWTCSNSTRRSACRRWR